MKMLKTKNKKMMIKLIKKMNKDEEEYIKMKTNPCMKMRISMNS